MILVTRLNGLPFAVNPDLLERVEATPDTVLTLIDGTKYIVLQTVPEVIDLVREYRASVVASARDYHEPPTAAALAEAPRRPEPARREHLHLAPVAAPVGAAPGAAPTLLTAEEA